MSVETVEAAIKRKLSGPVTLRTKVLFDFGAEGFVYVDSTASPPVVSSAEQQTPDLTLKTSLATFEAILAGTKDPNIAYMTGALKIQGPLGLAMRLNSFLED
jgi:putative sterol carrier protein